MQHTKKRKSGVGIDLKEKRISVEQALRELRVIMEDDIEIAKQKRYYEKPSAVRRESEKKKKANIRKYAKYSK